LGVLAVVKKRRTLLSLDATRIHLDNVDGLGDFIEFEVPVTGDDDAAK
jgi:adenylate cyclase class IV